MQLKLSKILIAISATTFGMVSAATTIDTTESINTSHLVFSDDASKETISEKLLIIEDRILNGETNEKQYEDNIELDEILSKNLLFENTDLNIVEFDESIEENIVENIELEDIVEKISIDKNEINRSNVFDLSSEDKNKLRKEILEKNKVNTESDSELIFLNNLPVGTKLIFNENFVIQPKVNRIIIQNGIVILEKPDIISSPSSYCRIDLVNSGRARVIKEGSEFIVIKNQSSVKKISNINFKNGPLKIQQQKIWVNNDKIKNISCYASSNLSDEKLPIMIYDLYKETNRSITVGFPAFEEI